MAFRDIVEIAKKSKNVNGILKTLLIQLNILRCGENRTQKNLQRKLGVIYSLLSEGIQKKGALELGLAMPCETGGFLNNLAGFAESKSRKPIMSATKTHQ